jgi:ArsR family metal-binding transcriptional regulator
MNYNEDRRHDSDAFIFIIMILLTFHRYIFPGTQVKDREEAENIISWLQREINQTWEHRLEIEPSTANAQEPVLLEVLKLLPKTNCKECNERTCLVFAYRVIQGIKDQNDCPPIAPANKIKLQDYLSQFTFNET